MRIYTDKKHVTHDRYIATQQDMTSLTHLAVKTGGEESPLTDGVWVYLTKSDALELAAQILQIASKLED